MDGNTIIKTVQSVTKKWTKQRKAEERGRARSRREALTYGRGPSIKDAAWRVMEEAYLKASDNGTLPSSARQIMYAARRQILDMTGQHALDSQYFSQRLLPDYIAVHPGKCAEWDVTYDARGHFCEPHTEEIIPLGTLDVRHYLAAVQNHAVESPKPTDFYCSKGYPTCGPKHRFSAIMFIEKEGFLPLFEKVNLADRFDIAIMSTKGMPVTACRHLADELCGTHSIPLLLLHDFDKAGFSIKGTLSDVEHDYQFWDERPKRYEFRHDFPVIDLGLRLEDVEEYGLESETVTYRSDPSRNLRENGATDEEIEFLCGGGWRYGGRRVELNAFTSRQFIDWIEAKLEKHGIGKVVPDDATLEAAFRRNVQIETLNQRLPAIVGEAAEKAARVKIPRTLRRMLRERLRRNPEQPWDVALAELAAANVRND